MKDWKIKLIEAIEAIVAVVGVILLVGEITTTPLGIVGIILVVVAALAFYITHNIALGRTAILAKPKNEIPVSEKKEEAKVAKAEQTSTDSTKKNK